MSNNVKTARGIYLNVKDSTFIATNGEINLFFSSASKLGKFLVGYHENRTKSLKKLYSIIGESNFPYDVIADMSFYEHIENKGVYAILDNVVIGKDGLDGYGVNCMAQQKVSEYQAVSNPEEIERIRSSIK